jgi:F-type H+-transporting ATPase subunit a
MQFEKAHASSSKEEGKFNPGTVIIGHITNAYEWHIFTTPGGKHVSLPLPVILYSQFSGFHIFLSSKFDHGHARYKNFEFATAGENKGKIVEYDEEGRLLNEKPLDISFTKNVLGLVLGLFLTFFIFMKALKVAEVRRGLPPKGILSIVEPLIIFVRDDIAKASIGHHSEKFLPYLLSVFFMIFVTNLTGLVPVVPFGANVTGNISVTLGLALFTFVTINYNANRNYWKHIYNTPGVPWWMKFPIPIMPFVEFLGVLMKPLVLAIRLFANIMAGHIVVLAFICLIFIFAQLSTVAAIFVSPVTLVFVVFITCLEVLVAFIQAFVFTLLSAIFIGMAVAEHH